MSTALPEVEYLVKNVLSERARWIASTPGLSDAAERIWQPTHVSGEMQSEVTVSATEEEFRARGFETRRYRGELQIRASGQRGILLRCGEKAIAFRQPEDRANRSEEEICGEKAEEAGFPHDCEVDIHEDGKWVGLLYWHSECGWSRAS